MFAVGASPYDDKTMVALKERNFKEEFSHIPCFYCRGAWNEENDLMISASSDCHGEFNNRALGVPKVNIDKIKLDFIETI